MQECDVMCHIFSLMKLGDSSIFVAFSECSFPKIFGTSGISGSSSIFGSSVSSVHSVSSLKCTAWAWVKILTNLDRDATSFPTSDLMEISCASQVQMKSGNVYNEEW